MVTATDQEILVEAQERLLNMREERKAMGLHGPNPLSMELTEVIESCKKKAAEHLKNGLIVLPLQTAKEPRHISILSLCGVGKKYLGCTFDNFHGGTKLVEALKQLAVSGQSALITGNTGSGKTHLAVAMLAEYLKSGGKDALIITIQDLLLEIGASYSDKSMVTEKGVVDFYSSRRFLVLDDLGAEKPSEHTIAKLSQIIDRRINQERQTIITTNLTIKDIAEYSSARIASRISAMELILVDMPDYRKKR